MPGLVLSPPAHCLEVVPTRLSPPHKTSLTPTPKAPTVPTTLA